MSGHNRWTQIKHQKGAADQKRGQLFSKLLKAISIAAKTDPSPQFNPRLRSAIAKAKSNNLPQENIDRAINKASEAKNLEDLIIEAYGPEGTAIIIEAVTDNKNRALSEIKHLISNYAAKIAEPGSVLWAFEKQDSEWKPKFPQAVSVATKEKIRGLIKELNEYEDVQKVVVNINC